jgi:acid phosphatase family membrane protein YuiD
MNVLNVITSNYIINVGVVAFFSAQLLKMLFVLVITRKLVWERMVGAGGMPSSHAALTVSISVAMENKVGFASPLFGLTLAFTAVVLYDAMGVRRAAGEQAKVLNRIVFEFMNIHFFGDPPSEPKELPVYIAGDDDTDEPGDTQTTDITDDTPETAPLLNKELKEFLGHTPLEVLGGCLVGILVAVFMPVV